MATTGQTINDRLNAMRYALVGQGLARTVCKATTEEVLAPKKKHIDYLLACINEPNVSVPQMANLIIERTHHTSWTVVFKGLITIHHLMSAGNERFAQFLATSNHSFELNDFMDRTTPQGYSMSTYVRKYAKYIDEKVKSFRVLAIDLCKIKAGGNNALSTMNMENLSKTLPIVQAQFDSLLNFAPESKDLNNGIILAAFRLLYKDLVRMYVAYQEAIINMLERYFKLSRKKTREALGIYKIYLDRMSKVAGFLKVVEAVGLDKSEMPDLTKSPASILPALEKHLQELEAKKRGATPASPETEAADDKDSDKENKESEPTSSSVKIEQPKPKDEPKVAETQVKKDPPPRPSPKASPNASPAKSRPTSSPVATETKPSTSASTSTASSSVQPPKSGPPSRPAKPPSRPPPPSATAGTTSAPAPAHVPPPHPPPPHPAPPSSSTSTKVRPETTATSASGSSSPKRDATETDQVKTESSNEPQAVAEDEAAQSQPEASQQQQSSPEDDEHVNRDNPPAACSGSVSVAVEASAQVEQNNQNGTQETEENHVNHADDASSVEAVAEEPAPAPAAPAQVEEMPPPPPPIEDDEVPAGQPQVNQDEAPQVADGPAEPEVNGQGNGAAD